MNAFERGDELVVDLCAYEDATIIDSLYLDDARPARARSRARSSAATRSTWPAAACAAEPLADGSLELPRIDYGRRNTRDYSYAYFTGRGQRAGSTGW